MKGSEVKSIYYNVKTKKRCTVQDRKASFWNGTKEIVSVIFIMDATPDVTRVMELEYFDRVFNPEFVQ